MRGKSKRSLFLFGQLINEIQFTDCATKIARSAPAGTESPLQLVGLFHSIDLQLCIFWKVEIENSSFLKDLFLRAILLCSARLQRNAAHMNLRSLVTADSHTFAISGTRLR